MVTTSSLGQVATDGSAEIAAEKAPSAKGKAKRAPAIVGEAKRHPAEIAVPSSTAKPTKVAKKVVAGKPTVEFVAADFSAEADPAVELATHEVATRIWKRVSARRASIFERRWWDDRILAAAMADESLKVQMFRFVDVLPRLKTHESVTRHLQEYFEEVREYLPWAVQLIRFGVEHMSPQSVLSRALAYNARRNAEQMAQRFIAGSTSGEVLATVKQLRHRGFAFTLDLLGEAVISEPEADRYQQQYLHLIEQLAPEVRLWPANDLLDGDHLGPIPQLNLSIKLSALVSHFRAIDPVGTGDRVKARLRTLLRAAQSAGAHLHVDMEHYAYKDLTLAIFRECLMEPEFREFRDVGVVIQAYLKDSERDLRRLLEWSQARGTSIAVRLVKGAYWDYETVVAHANGWETPVYENKWQSDANFERLATLLLQNHNLLRPAFGSHNLRSLAFVMGQAQQLAVPAGAYEIQMLYGMATEMSQAFAEQHQRVRIYTPFGQLIPGMAYLVRRLLENTSNESFLRRSDFAGVDLEELLMKPAEAAQKLAGQSKAIRAKLPLDLFQNEPLTDFSREEARAAMESAIESVSDQLGETYAAVINGRREESRTFLNSKNPSRKEELVGRIFASTPDMALEAIASARRAFRHWSRVDVSYRVEYLELIARELSERRFELAAWEVFEVGKPWAEADADVAEAIDFCRYYSAQMQQLANPQRVDLPGEENAYSYRARGVVVVIAPWNFPLAILAGMTTAALAAGNTVVMKPAEQSSVVAAKFMEILQGVGLPDGVVNFLPGSGEELGPILVGSPEVDLVAFTGSREVGLAINRHAAEPHAHQQTVKHVIAEMGGKNAIIVDGDADLDEAVQGVIQSAFGYAGQKCSACSRVIVLAEVYDEFTARLVEATSSLVVGPADQPATLVGPVIDLESSRRIKRSLEAAVEAGAQVLLSCALGPSAKLGYFIGPVILADVTPDSSIAQEELFGPVLVAFKAKDFAEALDIANDTPYALTGGVYSRSPANLKKARTDFAVGNLYLNRPITGALVGRQPFGGFKMSGIGSKAGGPDYLKHFLIPINVTENTLRRGFAPETHAEGAVSE